MLGRNSPQRIFQKKWKCFRMSDCRGCNIVTGQACQTWNTLPSMEHLRFQTILYGVVAPHSLIALGCHNSTINHNKVCWLDKEMNRACSLKTRLCCGTGRGAAYPLKTQQLGVHPFHMWLVCLFTCNNDIIWHTSVYLAHSSVFCTEMHGEGTDCYTLMLPKPVRA